MIPGGKAGLRYLRQNGMLSKHTVPQPDERDQFLLRWMRDNPRKGVPAPWISEKWKDDAWATAQICGRQGRLSVQQIAAVRRLAYNYDVEDIAERIGAMNASQVQRVIEGKTYS